MSAPTFTQRLRQRVVAKLGGCPVCGHRGSGPSLRQAAKAMGVNHTTLWRFVDEGKAPSAALVDKLVEWLGDDA